MPGFLFEFETDANAKIDGMYRMIVTFSLEGGDGATIFLDNRISQVLVLRGGVRCAACPSATSVSGPGVWNAQTIKTYNYTGPNFTEVFSGSRFDFSDSITGTLTIDCALAGETGACRSLPVADHAAALTSFSFTASGSPDLTITSANALPGSVFEFETDANAKIDGMYRMTVTSLVEGTGSAAIRISLNNVISRVQAAPDAARGEGFADSGPGVWLLVQPNLVDNGSFEDPALPGTSSRGGLTDVPVGWTSDGDFEIWRGLFGFMAQDGSQHLEMDVAANTTIFQNLVTVPGTTYRLSFALANRPNFPGGGGPGPPLSRIEASWDANVVLTAERTESTWEVFETFVTATKSTTRLQFRAAGTSDGLGDFLDDVQVVEAPDLVENGSFEDPALRGTASLTDVPVGWTSDGGFEIWRGLFGFMAQDGSQHLEMDVAANTTIFQDLATVPGTTYRLSFALANRPDFPGGGGPGPPLSRIEASWGGNPVLTAERSEGTWQVSETLVTATSETTRLLLRAAGTSDGLGDFLDDVRVVPAPDPGLMMLAPMITSIEPTSLIVGGDPTSGRCGGRGLDCNMSVSGYPLYSSWWAGAW